MGGWLVEGVGGWWGRWLMGGRGEKGRVVVRGSVGWGFCC